MPNSDSPSCDSQRFDSRRFDSRRFDSQRFDSSWILENRGPKNAVLPDRPYAYLIEKERSQAGVIENIGTVFLTNKECPFRCLMCDLWKNTTDYSVTPEQIDQQVLFSLSEFAKQIERENLALHSLKLYNSGNFFDRQAIHADALERILARVHDARKTFAINNLIVENHPKLVGNRLIEFANRLETRFEVAMGLETIHPDILPRLNKQMDLDDFKRATHLLVDNGINVRAFILLKTPFMNDEQGIEWALKSTEWAFAQGVNCCAVIPTRTGNGAMEKLLEKKLFAEPRFEAMESFLEQGLNLVGAGQRLFIDLWDASRFADCQNCIADRVDRLNQINLLQVPQPKQFSCDQCQNSRPRVSND